MGNTPKSLDLDYFSASLCTRDSFILPNATTHTHSDRVGIWVHTWHCNVWHYFGGGSGAGRSIHSRLPRCEPLPPFRYVALYLRRVLCFNPTNTSAVQSLAFIAMHVFLSIISFEAFKPKAKTIPAVVETLVIVLGHLAISLLVCVHSLPSFSRYSLCSHMACPLPRHF